LLEGHNLLPGERDLFLSFSDRIDLPTTGTYACVSFLIGEVYIEDFMASHALWCQSTEVQAAILHHQDSDAIICNALSENIQSAHHKGGKRGMC
jgi:hypothetical protein